MWGFYTSEAQNYDTIRLSTYRTACKLRFIQKKCNCECYCNTHLILCDKHLPAICQVKFKPNSFRSSFLIIILFLSVHLVDVWNIIEAIRDNGLNTLDVCTEISLARLETIITCIYQQLNKRLPTTHQINVQHNANLLLNFMLAARDRCVMLSGLGMWVWFVLLLFWYCDCVFYSDAQGMLTVFSVKVMLSVLCGGKLVDKLRCEFTYDLN